MMDFLTEYLVQGVYDLMMPFMLVAFAIGVVARVVIYITVKCEWRFAVEFEHRVEKFIIDESRMKQPDFHIITQDLLNKTHYEFYLLKAERRMRRFDCPVTYFERVFGIVKASERIIEDTLKQTQYVTKSEDDPDFDRVAKYVFGTNPYYNRFLGVIPKNIIDDTLNIFPGLLIICGILGTFVGIVGGIPELGKMDVTDVESTSTMLSLFLNNMAFAMTTSILGMFLSLVMTLLNTTLSPYATYVDVIDIYKNSLNFIWKECVTGKKTERRGDTRKSFGKGDSSEDIQSNKKAAKSG